jgi:hypothetical protein
MMPPLDWFPENMEYRQMISLHLSGNFYPPLPQAYVEPAVQAMEACELEDWTKPVTIPAGTDPMPRAGKALPDGSVEIEAARLLDILRLEVPYDGD